MNSVKKTVIFIRIMSVAVICVTATVLLCLIACKKQSSGGVTRDCFAMDTYFTMKAYGADAADALEAAELEIIRLEGLFSVTSEGSDVRAINHAGGEAVSVDADTYALIEAAVQMGDETDGALDITLYPVVREWGFTTGTYRVPEAERIAELLENVDYREISLENGTVQLPDGMELDLGSVAKGYTGDKLTELLKEYGVTSALLDLGGNVQAIGSKPDGSDWTVAVRNPFYEDGTAELYTLGTLSVSDKCVITSGNYERCFTAEDGQTYGHIIDPADGYPADNGLVSVTIIADNGISADNDAAAETASAVGGSVVGTNGFTCDALSTALYVCGMERAIGYWIVNQSFDMILVTDTGDIYITPGIVNSFEPAEGVGIHVIDSKTMLVYHFR